MTFQPDSFPDASRGFRMQPEPLLNARLRPDADPAANEDDDDDMPVGMVFP